MKKTFLNTFYFPRGYGAKLVYAALRDILVHFLKNVVPQLWASYQ